MKVIQFVSSLGLTVLGIMLCILGTNTNTKETSLMGITLIGIGLIGLVTTSETTTH